MGCLSCGGGKSSSSSRPKGMPKNWGGMNLGSSGGSKMKSGSGQPSGGFGKPAVRMSFSGKKGK